MRSLTTVLELYSRLLLGCQVFNVYIDQVAVQYHPYIEVEIIAQENSHSYNRDTENRMYGAELHTCSLLAANALLKH